MDAETLVNMQSRYNLLCARNDKKINDFLQNIRKMCAAL
jgi:plasmid maintenance system antidote protein VapI